MLIVCAISYSPSEADRHDRARLIALSSLQNPVCTHVLLPLLSLSRPSLLLSTPPVLLMSRTSYHGDLSVSLPAQRHSA